VTAERVIEATVDTEGIEVYVNDKESVEEYVVKPLLVFDTILDLDPLVEAVLVLEIRAEAVIVDVRYIVRVETTVNVLVDLLVPVFDISGLRDDVDELDAERETAEERL
jgi:hypothetical protein